ncbi:MAG: MBL fold metallo-hydrolase [Candidatus Thermoplasmatota archaeon]|nr:MBL fold metallo-hydrolase [Candidatus Thermoplasmatota archaeon]MDI6887826.1 MBL fold metallo-hydrolase [Candidatus Thermoplasmatota archaeon]
MKIRWHGHACFEISNELTIVTDPHDGKSIGIKPPAVKGDIVLVSHDHYDHNCVRVVKGDKVEIVKESGIKKIKNVTIKGIRTYHDSEQGSKRGDNIIFAFMLDDVSFCHLGDLGHALNEEQAKALGAIDIVFIPVGGTFTINGKESWEVVKVVRPKVIVPMHYKIAGLSLPIAALDDFLEKRPDDVGVSRVGNEIEFEKEDLPEKTEIWVFTL